MLNVYTVTFRSITRKTNNPDWSGSSKDHQMNVVATDAMDAINKIGKHTSQPSEEEPNIYVNENIIYAVERGIVVDLQ